MSRLKQYLINKSKQISSKPLPLEKYDKLVFGQVNCGNKSYFERRFGQCHTIFLNEFPHVDFIKNHLQNPMSEHEYCKYLKASWEYIYSKKKKRLHHQRQINRFIKLYQKTLDRIKRGKEPFDKPVELCQRPDGKLIVANGNHRVAIAWFLGKEIKAYYLKPEKYLKKIAAVPNLFYGSARKGLPYQSIFNGDEKLVCGRRPDIKERMDLIDEKDLKNNTVLDLGCNIGASCFITAQAGAISVTGIDVPDLINVALKLNTYFATQCEFASFDLNNELDAVPAADVTFCFSVYNHIKNKQALINTILNKTKKILYFEGHGNSHINDYIKLLNKDNFKTIDLIGYTSNGIHTTKRNRPLYRCEIAKQLFN